MLIELEILLQKYFGTSSPKPTETKKPTPEKPGTPREKLDTMISEIGRDMFGVRVHIDWGRCPYCENVTQMLSTRIGYFRCATCREMTKQYINGRIAYLPINDYEPLPHEPKEN